MASRHGLSIASRQLRYTHSSFHRRSANRLQPFSLAQHAFLPFDDDRRDQELRLVAAPERRHFHSSVPTERAAAIILTLGAVSAASYGVATAVRAYNQYKEESAKEAAAAEEEAKKNPQPPPSEEETKEEVKADEPKEKSGPRENIFESWFGVGVGAKYYEGGFEEKMTRREAALILGVRESSSVARVKDAHRKLLILNHPDTGGSTYISGKINEAKELLLKGRRG
jgi:hypothetical protein